MVPCGSYSASLASFQTALIFFFAHACDVCAHVFACSHVLAHVCVCKPEVPKLTLGDFISHCPPYFTEAGSLPEFTVRLASSLSGIPSLCSLSSGITGAAPDPTRIYRGGAGEQNLS